AAYETNRDLVMMGAYRQGADPLLDEAIALYPRMCQFLSQSGEESVDLATAFAQMNELVGRES
ncbi:MAG: flagellum-specific ATP synthase FliI, partial [Pseudomonadota bacterium]|nr:flagellum-specific ATP synthase FliI [Pseudomonadota bacterium]